MKTLSPAFLIGLSFLQVIFAYLTNMDEIAEQYSTNLSYIPLYLWLVAFAFVVLGNFVFTLLDRRASTIGQMNYEFFSSIIRIDYFRLYFLFWLSIIGLSLTMWLISFYAGGTPIFQIISGSKGSSLLNEMQAYALPGLYGFHALLISLLEYCIGALILKNIFTGADNKSKLILGIIIIVIACLIEGKRQGIVMFLFFIGVVILYASKVMMGKSTQVFLSIRNIFIVLSVLLFIIVTFITYVRLEGTEAIGYGDQTAYEPLRYLSLPLLNLEALSSIAGLEGYKIDLLKPFEHMLPAKLFLERGEIDIRLPEPTSPSGLFAMCYLYWGGVFGIIIYAFLVGLFSGFIYSRAVRSSFFLMFYGFIAWSLVMSHTYNHFLTITFLPLQLIVMILFKFIVLKKSNVDNIKQTHVGSANKRYLSTL